MADWLGYWQAWWLAAGWLAAGALAAGQVAEAQKLARTCCAMWAGTRDGRSPIHSIVKSEPLMTSHVWGKTIELLRKLETDDAQLRYC